MYDPMLDYTIKKIEAGIKELRRLNSYKDYDCYAHRIAQGLSRDIEQYIEYLSSLSVKRP